MANKRYKGSTYKFTLRLNDELKDRLGRESEALGLLPQEYAWAILATVLSTPDESQIAEVTSLRQHTTRDGWRVFQKRKKTSAKSLGLRFKSLGWRLVSLALKPLEQRNKIPRPQESFRRLEEPEHWSSTPQPLESFETTLLPSSEQWPLQKGLTKRES